MRKPTFFAQHSLASSDFVNEHEWKSTTGTNDENSGIAYIGIWRKVLEIPVTARGCPSRIFIPSKILLETAMMAGLSELLLRSGAQPTKAVEP